VVGKAKRAPRILPQERAAVAWAFLYFFCILCGYYTLRPLRDEMGIVGGVRNLPWQFTATFVVMLLAVPLYSAVVARTPRRKIIPIVYRFCAANLVAFLVLDRSGVSEVWVARIFFVWVSVFNLLVVSVFWSFIVDTFREGQGKRLFGAIASGGGLGAIVGPALAAALVEPLGRPALFVTAAVLLEAAVQCVKRLIAWAEKHRAGGTGDAPDRPVGGGVLAGFRLALASPYLLAIMGMLFAYTATSTVLYSDQAHIVEAAITDSSARTALFARIDLWVNLVALSMQAIGTGWVLTAFGLTVALCVLPLVTAGGFAGLAVAPGLETLVVFQIARRGLQYGLERPSREVLYTVVSSEEKYKAKAFIDTIVFRGGDAVAIWAYAAARSAGTPPAAVTAVMLAVCAGWVGLAWYASRRHARLAAAEEARHGPQTP
jgi:AAA family ATP:ADP antiporter